MPPHRAQASFQGRPIDALPPYTAALIRAGTIIPNFISALLVLLTNALDADPLNVRVALDPVAGFVSVADDGHGIDQDLLRHLGHFQNISPQLRRRTDYGSYTYARKGDALASLAHVSTLDITSRTSHQPDPRQTLHGRRVFFGRGSTPILNSGTVAVCRDLFANMPARQPPTHATYAARAAWLTRQVSACRDQVARFAILHPGVAFAVDQVAAHSQIPRKRILTLSKAESEASRFAHIFGYHLAQSVPLSFTIDDAQMSGFVSQNPHHNRSAQLFYYNGCPFSLSADTHQRWAERVATYLNSPTGPNTAAPDSADSATRKTIESLSVAAFAQSFPAFVLKYQNVSACESEGMPFDEPALLFAKQVVPSRPSKRRRLGLLGDAKKGLSHWHENAAGKSISRTPQSAPKDIASIGSFPSVDSSRRVRQLARQPMQSHSRTSLHMGEPNSPAAPFDFPTTSSLLGLPLTLRRQIECPLYGPSGLPASSLSCGPGAICQFVGQVDQKFLLASTSVDVHPGDRCRLVKLVDQHAAHERVRVEDIYAKLCTQPVESRLFEQPRPILVSSAGQDDLLSHVQRMSRFGFSIIPVLNGKHNSGEWMQVRVEAVPDVLAGRLQEAEDLAHIIEQSFQYLQHEYDIEPAPLGRSASAWWISTLRLCPQPLKRLANSVACRGAVFFEDRLSPAEGELILSEWMKTAFPAICAHGRPSYIDIAALDSRPPASRGLDWAGFLKQG